MKKKPYRAPRIDTEVSFETTALACGKTSDPPPGAFHFGHAYDTFTGHFGNGFGVSESISGTAGIGFTCAATSMSYSYTGLCGNWIVYQS